MDTKKRAASASPPRKPKRQKPNPADDTIMGEPQQTEPVQATRRTIGQAEHAGGVVPTDHGPTVQYQQVPDLDFYLIDFKNGQLNDLAPAFNDVLASRDEAQILVWIRAILSEPDILQYASVDERPFVLLIVEYQFRKLKGVEGCSDRQLAGYLAGFDAEGAEYVAVRLIGQHWHRPEVLDGAVYTWLLGIPRLLDTSQYLRTTALLLNMLWNARAFEPLCALITAGAATATPAVVDLDTKAPFIDEQTEVNWTPEGIYSGHVQPIEHLLGHYVRLVSLLHPSEGPAATGAALAAEVRFLGSKSPGVNLNEDLWLDIGREKVKGARQVLEALATREAGTQIATSFAQVQQSSMIKAFALRPGWIWGFESVRLPFVQAARLTWSKPEQHQPVRVWEVWAAVLPALTEKKYRELLRDPDGTIKDLVGQALGNLQDMFQKDPLAFPGLDTDDARKSFAAAFTQQATSYLEVLAERPPTFKFATAADRGYGANHFGAGGCKVGLWWARKVGMPVYYCLDGVDDTDVIKYKSRKTWQINDFIDNPDNDRYDEVITLAEIREILVNWTDLKSTVQFCRKGVFLTEAQVADLISRMQAADADVQSQRSTPIRGIVQHIWATATNPPLPALTGPPFSQMESEVFYHVVTQLLLMELALDAKNSKVLSSFLVSKGAKVLFDHQVLPPGFGETYLQVVSSTTDTNRALMAKQLQNQALHSQLPDPFKTKLRAAIEKFSGGLPIG
jgi:hypothetical protein